MATVAPAPQWVEARDPTSGQSYWYDAHNRNLVTWTDPTGGASAVGPANPQPPHAHVVHVNQKHEWAGERFDFSDTSACCFGLWCCPIMWAQTIERVKLATCFPAIVRLLSPCIGTWFLLAFATYAVRINMLLMVRHPARCVQRVVCCLSPGAAW